MQFVIIGNGVAGITAALALREREPHAKIAVISGETDYFFSRTALMYAFMDRMSRRDLEPYERKVWKKQQIELVRGWVSDLNAADHSIELESGRRISYDRLLLATGSAPNRIPWKGMDAARSGVVHFVSMQDLDECERQTRAGGKAIVVGGGLIGVELVECLRFHGMDVTFLVREPWYWPMALGEEESGMVTEHIRRHGVNLLLDELVSEVRVDGQGGVQGLTTESGLRLDAEILGVTVGVRPAVDWLKNVTTPPEMDRGIVVGPDFATSLNDVWAAGDVAEVRRPGEKPFVEQIWYSAKRQGRLAALAMLGDTVDYRPPIFFNSSKFFEIEFTTVGRVVEREPEGGPMTSRPPEGARSFHAQAPDKEISIRIVEQGGAVIGFNMLGSRWNHAFFERWVAERRSLEYVMEHLHEAQFDVEFGRADLAPLREQYRRWNAAHERAGARDRVAEEA